MVRNLFNRRFIETMKKFLTAILMTISALAMAGCNGEKNPSVSENSDPSISSPSEVTLSYQFLGNYYEVANQYASFDFLGNLNSDGTGTLYTLTGYSDKSRDTLSESPVTWKVEEDRDGIKTMTFNEEGTGTIESYETDGKFTLSLKFTFAGSYSRTIDFVGSDKIQYKTVEAWRNAVEGKAFEEKEPSGGDEDTKKTSYTFTANAVIIDASSEALKNCAAECVLNGDGTAMARNGYAMNGTIYSDYVKEEGTWKAAEDGSLSITLKEKEYKAIKNKEGLLAFTWHTENKEGAGRADIVQVE